MSGTRLRPGRPARAGVYRCADCGYELRVKDLSSMPPCPRSGELEHESNEWDSRGGHRLVLGLAAATVVVVGALVYARGARRVASEAWALAEEGRMLAAKGQESAVSSARRVRRAANRWLP